MKGLYMTNEIAKLSDTAQSLAYKLRLNNLDATKRILRKYNIENNDGFLTIEGAQIFLDALWQKNPDIQEEIADGLRKMRDEEKGKKDADQ